MQTAACQPRSPAWRCRTATSPASSRTTDSETTKGGLLSGEGEDGDRAGGGEQADHAGGGGGDPQQREREQAGREHAGQEQRGVGALVQPGGPEPGVVVGGA